MTFPMLIAFIGVLAVVAAAADVDQRLRDRYTELDEAVDLCRGAQPDRTPDLRGGSPIPDPIEGRIRNATPCRQKTPERHPTKNRATGANHQILSKEN